LKLLVYQFFIKPFTFILLLITPVAVFSQNSNKIDSITRHLETLNGIDKFDGLLDLARLNIGDKEKCLSYLNEAQILAYQVGDTAKIVRINRAIGEIHRRFEENTEALKILIETLPVARRNNLQNDIKYILNSLAIVYATQANYDKALSYHFESLIIREAQQNKEEISVTLNNIGFVYFKLRSYERALEFFHRALTLKREIHDSYDLDRLLINIGLCYNQLNKFSDAQKYFNEAFVSCGNKCTSQIIVEGQFGLGVSNFGQENFDEALSHFRESLAVAKQTDYKRFQAENLVYLGKIFFARNQPDSAIKSLNGSEKLAVKFGYNELLIDTYRQFSILYNSIDNYEAAADYQGKYISLKDSVYSERLIENLARIQTNFQERQNIKTIADKDEIIVRQRSLSIAIVIIAILASLLVFVLYRSNRVKKKVNAALSEAKAIIEDQNKQLLNSNIHLNEELKEKNIDLEIANESLRRVNDELDNFIYKTSHDIRGPLASLKGMCNVALIDVQDPLALDYLHKLDITADKLNTILTRLLIVNQINNSAIGHEPIDFDEVVNDVLLLEKKKGLPPNMAIRRHIGLGIEFYSDREFVRIILENLIDNAVKFYNDSKRAEPFVDVFIAEEKNKINIRVVDNGIGISKVNPDKIFQMFSRASERSETGGIGLYITKTAVEKLGGIIDLKTTSEGFTEFFIQLPRVTSKVVA
jgi:signal transduction histidine kinase